jgi:non-ribosomal peptide synthetase component F
MANRSREEFLGMIGCFMNQVALRCDLSGDPTFIKLLEQVREQVLKALFHQALPFTELVRLVKPKRSPNQNPLFQVEFLYQSYDMPLPDWTGLKITRADFEVAASKFDLSVIIETREEFEIKFEYNTDLFEADTIRAMLRQYEWVLQNILHHPEAHLSDFPTGFPCPIERSAVSATVRTAV